MKKNNGTASLVKWTVMGLLAGVASFVQANTWTRSGSMIYDANGWTVTVAAVTGGLSLPADAVVAKGTPSGVLDLSGTISDGSTIIQFADNALRTTKAGTLYSVTLPTTLVNIGVTVFSGQASLTNVTPLLPSTVKTIGNNAFDGIPIGGAMDLSAVTNLGTIVFRSTSITSVVCNANLKTLSDRAFETCKSLLSAQLPSSLETIGINVFNGCTNLSVVSPMLPTTVKTVGDLAFSGVPMTGALDLSSVTNLGQQAYRTVSGITSVVFNAQLKTIPYYAFEACKRLYSAQLPANLQTLGDHAFSSCTNLYALSPALPNTVTSIVGNAFSGVPYSGRFEVLNSGYRVVNGQIFGTATRVSQFVFGTGVTNVADYAFDHLAMGSLSYDIYFYGTAPTFGANIIRSTVAYNTRFFVPSGDAGWGTFIAANVTAPTFSETTNYTAKWPGATLPVGGWTPTSCTRQYVVQWTPPGSVPRGTVVLFR